MDALIELSDENADWKLSFKEFLKCLDPSFNPPEKSRDFLPVQGWIGAPERVERTESLGPEANGVLG